MGLLRKLTVIASGTALVGGIGLTGLVTAAPASATESPDASPLCVTVLAPTRTICATAPSDLGDPVQMPPSGYSNWFYPISGTGEIKRLNTSDCMSEDNSSVIYVACNGEQAQEWSIYMLKDNNLYGMFQNTSGECLAYGAEGEDLYAATCNTTADGQWFEP